MCKNDPYGTIPAASSLYASPSLTSTVSGTLEKDAVVHVRGVLIQGDGTKWYGIQQGSGFVYLPSANITFHVSPNVNAGCKAVCVHEEVAIADSEYLLY